MFKNLKIQTRAFFLLGIMVLVLIGTIFYVIRQINLVAEQTNLLYRHPLTVSNAVYRIQRDLCDLNNKYVLISQSPTNKNELIESKNTLIKKIDKDFEIIYDRFLGDKKQIIEVEEPYKAWITHQESIITASSDTIANYILDSEGAALIDPKLNETLTAINNLEQFAQGKANTFLKDAIVYKSDTVTSTLVIMSAGLLILLVGFIILVRSITNPLKSLVTFSQKVARGDLSQQLNSSGNDEIGEVTKALNQIVSEFNQALKVSSKLNRTVNNTMVLLQGELKNLTENSSHQAKSNDGLVIEARDIVFGSNQNIERLNQINEAITDTQNHYQIGADVIKSTADSLIKISENISFIDEISSETNLLSLNASVEAVRAGNFGKSFMVIADEIRNLSNSTLEYAKVIKSLTNNSEEITKDSNQALSKIEDSIINISDLVQSIREENMHFVNRVNSINELIEDLQQNSNSNAQVAVQLQKRAVKLETACIELNNQIAFFKL